MFDRSTKPDRQYLDAFIEKLSNQSINEHRSDIVRIYPTLSSRLSPF